MDNISDILLNSENDASVSDQEAAAYVHGTMAPGMVQNPSITPRAVQPQPPPQQQQQQQQQTIPQQTSALIQYRLLYMFIIRAKTHFTKDIQDKIDILNNALRNKQLQPVPYSQQLKALIYPRYPQQWAQIIKGVNEETAKYQQKLQQTQHVQSSIHKPNTQSDPAQLEAMQREKRLQIQRQLQQQVKTEKTNQNLMYANTGPQTKIPIPSSLGKRPLTAATPPNKRPTVNVRTRNTRADSPMSSSALVNVNLVRARIQAIAQSFKIPNIDDDVLELMELALHERLLNVTEQLVSISHKRMDVKSDVFECFTTSDPKFVLRDIQQREQEDAKRHENEQSAQNANNKSKSKEITPAERLKEIEQTNMAALNAVGDVRKRKPKYQRKPLGGTQNAGPNQPTADSLQQIRRVTYKDALVFLERDECQLTPVFSYKCMLGNKTH